MALYTEKIEDVTFAMKKPGWEIIGAISSAIMTLVALILTVVYHNIPAAVGVVFVGTYLLISTEKVNRTAMSLL